MSFLLDTHSFLWAAMAPEKLSERAKTVLSDENKIFVSAVSFWEIALKYSLGKLVLGGVAPEQLPAVAQQMKFECIPLDPDESASYRLLPKLAHKDPFDRMLIWQCMQHQWTLISSDKVLREYQSLGLKLLF
jgi:PIN domain nuclease of toxin-antitoxin system